MAENFQSPLHRGRLFNLPGRLQRRRTPGIFQSPLHRGRLFNRSSQRGFALGYWAFSPLFIGEGSSTSA